MEPGQPASSSLLGQVVAGFRLELALSTGVTGTVFYGRRADTGQDVAAIEVLTPSPTATPEERSAFRDRFLQDCQRVVQIQHPHILPIAAFGEGPTPGYCYLVTPYLPGGALSAQLRPQPMVLSVAATYVAQVADALDFANARGVIHGDLTPANILLDAQGQLWVADFGIARLFAPTGGGMATPAAAPLFGASVFMAPEQARGEPIGPAADTYSLGVLAYQFVTGQIPASPTAPLPPRQIRPDLPPPAEAAILRALANQPQDRFPSAGAFARALGAGMLGQWTDGVTPGATPLPMSSTSPMTPVSLVSPMSPMSPMSPDAQAMAPTVADYTPPQTPPQMTYPPQMTFSPKAGASSRATNRALALGGAILALLIIAILLVDNVGGLRSAIFGPHTGAAPVSARATATTQQASATSASGGVDATATTAPPTGSGARVPAGALIYRTSAPGKCDTKGGSWTPNPSAAQTCSNGGLVLAGPTCNCPLGVVALGSIPGQGYPQNYVAQISERSLGADPTAFFGFKFRQQSADDTGQGRGGYAVLIAQNGQFQYNRYSSDGTRSVLNSGSLPVAVNTTNTLDLIVNGSQFSFYLNGRLMFQQDDATYDQGYLCLVAEPGAQILYQNLALYQPSR
ncbi:MAG TPA: protein kinase [Ktedonobacterales bacterium]|nr:protein kinase [Ktedonobacterales bacterium]